MVARAAVSEIGGLDDVRIACDAVGLQIVGGFRPDEDEGELSGIASLLLLGPGGSEMWTAFEASDEFADGKPHPMDRWSRRIISGLADQFGARAFFPFGGPPWHPFQRWAVRGEGAASSPVSMQVTPARGLWASYRGALGFADYLSLPEVPVSSPCLGCHAPCATACPVDAFRDDCYDAARCVAHVRSGEGGACLDGCLVRKSCPAGQGLDLPVAQRRFHMAAFLTAHPEPDSGG